MRFEPNFIEYLLAYLLVFLAIFPFSIKGIWLFNLIIPLLLIYFTKIKITKDIKLIILSFVIILILNVFNLIIFSEKSIIILKTIWKYITYIFFIIFFSTIKEFRTFKKINRTIIIFLTINLLFGLIIFFIGEPYSKLRMLILMNFDLDEDYLLYYSTHERIAGLTPSIFAFAHFLAVLPIFVIYQIENTYNKFMKILLFLILILSFLGIILNGERSIILGLILSYYLYYKTKSKKFFSYRHLLLASILLIFYYISSEFLQHLQNKNLITRLFEESSSEHLYPRLGKQLIAIYLTVKHPILGADYKEYEALTSIIWGYVLTYPHNAFINVGFKFGILAWISIIILVKIILHKYESIKHYSKSTIKKNLGFLYFIQYFSSLISIFSVQFFHNKGIYNGDYLSLILLGLVLNNYFNFDRNFYINK